MGEKTASPKNERENCQNEKQTKNHPKRKIERVILKTKKIVCYIPKNLGVAKMKNKKGGKPVKAKKVCYSRQQLGGKSP